MQRIYVHDLLTFLSLSTRGGSRPQVMSCWICLQGPAAMFDSAHTASFCTLAFGCLISWGRTFRTPASITAWVCRSEPLTMFPMERRAGVWCPEQQQGWSHLYLTSHQVTLRCRIIKLASYFAFWKHFVGFDPGTLPWHWVPHGSWAPPVGGQRQFSLQHQYGHCHHLWGRRLPSMHQTRCPYHWDGAIGSEMEAPEATTVMLARLLIHLSDEEWHWLVAVSCYFTYLQDCRQGWKRVLVSAQVGQCPR